MRNWLSKQAKGIMLKRIHQQRAFSLMELLMTVFIIGIVMTTIYFTLENMRRIHKKETEISQSQRNLQFIYYIFSQAAGQSEIKECKDNELTFTVTKTNKNAWNFSSAGKKESTPRNQIENSEKNEKVLLKGSLYRLTKTALGQNWFFFLHQENNFAAGNESRNSEINLKKDRFLFYHPRRSDMEYTPSTGLNENLLKQQMKESGKPVYLEWQCENLPSRQQLLHLSAFRQLDGKNILLRKKSYLFHWRKKQN